MRIFNYSKILFFKHFEKLIACVAAILIVILLFQSMSMMNVNAKNVSSGNVTQATVSSGKKVGNSKKIVKKKVKSKAKKKSKSKKKLKAKNKKKSKQKSKAKNKKKSKTKSRTKKTTTYKKTGNIVVDRLNSVTLKPDKFLSGKNEKILEKHLDKIVDDDMSNYQKAKTCYDYLINNTYYSYCGWGNAIESVLENGYGTCTEYSYVYMAMMRYLGFNAKTVDGSTAGGYGYHMWTEVKLGGNTYVFDPQVEDDMSYGKINYYRFCKSYSEVPGSYIKQ